MRSTRMITTVICTIAALGAGTSSSYAATTQPTPGPSTRVVSCGNGISLSVTTPGQGFDPETATNAELLANGLPARPEGDLAALKDWRHYVKHPTIPVLDCSTVQSPTHPRLRASTPSPNWDGWVGSGGPFTDSDATITVPSVSSYTTDTISTHWIGLGRYQNTTHQYPLMQMGVDVGWISGKAYYNTWAEVYGGSGAACTPTATLCDWQTNLGVAAKAGDHLYVHVGFAGTSSHFHIVNTTTGATRPDVVHTDSVVKNDGHIEFITEAILGAPFAHFSTVTFASDRGHRSSGWAGLYGLSKWDYHIVRNGVPTATHSAVNSSNAFTTTWQHV